MRLYFFDASAMVKLHAVEPGSRQVKAMVQSASVTPAAARIVVADLSHPETVSGITSIAFGSEAASRGLSPAAANRARADVADAFEPESVFMVLNSTGSLMVEAAELVWRHKIKASDAVQLATAHYARSTITGWSEFYFVGSDARQNSASIAEGLPVIDPAA